jgi:hypothetical protein
MTTAVELAQSIMDDAIGRAINVTDKGAITTKWAVVAEFVGESGEKFILELTDEDSMIWDTQGLLGYALDHLTGEE